MHLFMGQLRSVLACGIVLCLGWDWCGFFAVQVPSDSSLLSLLVLLVRWDDGAWLLRALLVLTASCNVSAASRHVSCMMGMLLSRLSALRGCGCVRMLRLHIRHAVVCRAEQAHLLQAVGVHQQVDQSSVTAAAAVVMCRSTACAPLSASQCWPCCFRCLC